VAAQLFLLGGIAFAPRELPGLPPLPAGLRVPAAAVGAVLLAAGLVVGGLGALQLGSNLTIFPRPKGDGELVESGVYGMVRHPIYTGVLLAALGFSLLRGAAPSLLLSLALWGFFELKARREERWLAEQFPRYRGYIRRVPSRIVPLHWPKRHE
jgi:protein-S-isoprenylcysteine O-methyltransferase Ste14